MRGLQLVDKHNRRDKYRRVYHIVIYHAFWVESILTYHDKNDKKKKKLHHS